MRAFKHPALIIRNDLNGAALLTAAFETNKRAVIIPAGGNPKALLNLAQEHLTVDAVIHSDDYTPSDISSSPSILDINPGPIIFTSGSTGAPKLVAYSWSSVTHQAEEVRTWYAQHCVCALFLTIVECCILQVGDDACLSHWIEPNVS